MKKSLNWLYDYPDLKLYQYEEAFKFSLDSILLAEFAEIKQNDNKILDMCTGNGVIPTIITYKTKKKIIGIELQKEIYDLAVSSATINNLSDKIHYICDDVKNIENYYEKEYFDVILCNPPYFPYSSLNHVNNNEMKKIARHEIFINLENIMEIASKMLKSKGRFYLVHLPSRLDEIIILAQKYRLAVKELQIIYAKEKEEATMVIVCLVKDAKKGIKVYAPVFTQGLETYQNIFKKRK